MRFSTKSLLVLNTMLLLCISNAIAADPVKFDKQEAEFLAKFIEDDKLIDMAKDLIKDKEKLEFFAEMASLPTNAKELISYLMEKGVEHSFQPATVEKALIKKLDETRLQVSQKKISEFIAQHHVSNKGTKQSREYFKTMLKSYVDAYQKATEKPKK